MPVSQFTSEINGVIFERYRDKSSEWWIHTDEKGREWLLYRQTARPQDPWTAVKMEHEQDGESEVLLNAAFMAGNMLDSKGPLYHLRGTDSALLLSEMANLIKDGRLGGR